MRARTKLWKDSKLTPTEVSSFESGIDVIGDIAIVKLRPGARGKEGALADAIMHEMKHVRAVFGQEGGIEGDFRLRKLRHLGGEERTKTLHKENGLQLKLDVETCYFSPRLSTERMRIAEQVEDGESVLNMFAGVGPYSILIAKRKGASVCSCELNEEAFDLHVENNRVNKVEKRVRMVKADAMRLPGLLDERFDRILMPLPSRSNLFLGVALSLAKPGGLIHYYRHVNGRNVAEAEANLARELSSIAGERSEFTTRKVREIGPRYLELVAEIVAP